VLLTRRSRRFEPPSLNMAAMIDIVFLLNVFFLCTASGLEVEREMRAQMPQVSTSPALEREFDPVRIGLRRAEDGVLVTCDGQPCETFKDLADMLRARRAIADVPVIIRAEEGVPYGKVVASLDACHGAGLRRVAFSTQGAGP